jgi:hypothetical protein
MAGYTRQEVYADTDVIEATHTNNEFDQIVAAFNSSTGHKHDGTAAEGPLVGLISDSTQTDKVQIVTGGAKTTGTHQVTGVLTADIGVTATTGNIIATAGDMVLTAGDVTLAALATVDGRDVSVDGAKLDGIETAATADQTIAEIKTAYEANANTNEFSDAEQTKLAGIETAATADQTGAEIKTAYQAEASAFTDAQFTKLAGIETAATADQTAVEVVFTATGNIIATDVQSAIAEVDTEKAALTGATFTGSVSCTTLAADSIDLTTGISRITNTTTGGGAFIDFDFDETTSGVSIRSMRGTTNTGLRRTLWHTGDGSSGTAMLLDHGTGDLAVTGAVSCTAFTSAGIDDNATGGRVQIANSLMTLGASGANYGIINATDDQDLVISGGSGETTGANIVLFGSTHASLANDMRFRTSGLNALFYDDSASLWDFQANDIKTTGEVVCSKIITPQGNSLTIAGGIITVTNSWHRVDTQSAASTDDLDTINGFTDGMQLYLRALSSANTVVLKDGTGNLVLAGDFSLDTGDDIIHLIYDGVSNVWKEVSRSDNGV